MNALGSAGSKYAILRAGNLWRWRFDSRGNPCAGAEIAKGGEYLDARFVCLAESCPERAEGLAGAQNVDLDVKRLIRRAGS